MATLKVLKKRIKTVKNTAKVTRAMQMISAARMKQTELLALQTTPYANGIHEVIKSIGDLKNFSSPLLKKVKIVNNIGIIIVGPSKGFVGGLISNLTLHIMNKLNEVKNKYPNSEIKAITIHKTALQVATSCKIDSIYHFSEYFGKPTTTELSPIYKVILDGFKDDKFDILFIAYTQFVNALKQSPVIYQILPIEFQIDETKSDVNSDMYIFEPNKSSILDFVLKEYFEYKILSAIVNSNASEESARMISMKNATDNANTLNKELTLEYNTLRQTKITNELLELSSNT